MALTSNCKSKNCIYLAICKLCGDFYIGQCQPPLHKRVNGHRSNFTESKFKDSALSAHIYLDHPQNFPNKVNNYKFAILNHYDTGHPLTDRENWLVSQTRAVTLHLNRYKVLRESVNLPQPSIRSSQSSFLH